jgi:L-iditol 2-dehydrogenase
VPKINVDHGVYVLPEPVSYEEGTMIEPLACALRAMRVINVCAGETVLILGAGISGILNIQAARLRGARVIVTDLDPGRLERALQFGAHQALSAAGPLDVKAEKVILCTGAYPAVETAFRCVDRKGTILLFAIPDRDITIPLPDAWRHEVTVTSSYGAAPADLEEALKLIADGKINVRDTVTHRFPLVDIQEAFRVVVAGGQALKVVLEP